MYYIYDIMAYRMVKSGLSDWGYQKQTGVNQTPRVSPYRLSLHLISAFTIYLITLKTALNLCYPVNNNISKLVSQRIKALTAALSILIFSTVFSGSFVAGNQAGLIYNEFPYMGKYIVPYDDIWINDIRPQWRNWFENSTLVQFTHRCFAITTLTATTVLWLYSKRVPLPSNVNLWLNTLLGVTSLQVLLGISTLLYHVPVSLGSAHQATALALLSTIITARHSMGSKNAVKQTIMNNSNNVTTAAVNTVKSQVSSVGSIRGYNTLCTQNNAQLQQCNRSYRTTVIVRSNNNYTNKLDQTTTKQSLQSNNNNDANNTTEYNTKLNGPVFAILVFSILLIYKFLNAPTGQEKEHIRAEQQHKNKII